MTDDGWHQAQMVGYDSETTGLDLYNDRVVTAAAPVVRPGQDPPVESHHWLIDPGIPIPIEATKIHGITTDHARANGQVAKLALAEIVEHLAFYLEADVPVILMNATYDLTLLDSNCQHLRVRTLTERLGHQPQPVIDILVLDKQLRPGVSGRGARTLGALCKAYNADAGQAHTSAADALAAVRVAWRMAAIYPQIAEMSPVQLHLAQARWKVGQDMKMAGWLRSKGREAADCDGQWPVRRKL